MALHVGLIAIWLLLVTVAMVPFIGILSFYEYRCRAGCVSSVDYYQVETTAIIWLTVWMTLVSIALYSGGDVIVEPLATWLLSRV